MPTCRLVAIARSQPAIDGLAAPRYYWAAALLAALAALAAGCNSNSSGLSGSPNLPGGKEAERALPPVRFVDVTAHSGVASTYENGEASMNRSIAESIGGGVGVCDYDRDGLWDLFFPSGGIIEKDQPLRGLPGTLWRNRGDMHFDAVAEPARAGAAEHYSHGCAMGDFDNDGFPDILVTGYGGLHFFHNLGDGTFEELHEAAGLTDSLWSTSAAWGDLDGDGDLDLYIAHYVDWSWKKHPFCPGPGPNQRDTCSPQEFEGLPDTIYFNQGDGTFREHQLGPEAAGKGLGVIATDVNEDNRLDVYVANDTTANLLFMNRGSGQFDEQGVTSGTAYDERGLPNGSMGVAVLDYDSDLAPDLWVANYQNETFALYRNDGGGMFRCLTESAGITALGTLYVGFGTVAADFAGTGREDLVVANGHVMHYSRSGLAQQPLLLRNTGRKTFVQQSFEAGNYFSKQHRGRGVVVADFDGDGPLDLVFSHINEPAAVMRQTTEPAGGWIRLELIGRTANRDAIGSRVVLTTDRGKQLRMIVGGGSYLSQNPYTVHFGLPPGAQPESVEITWPDGSVQQVSDLTVGAMHRLVQPGS